MKSKLIAIAVVITMLGGCANSKPKQSDNLQVITTSFIGYDLVKQIGKDKVDVENILPWGSELHNYEPTPKNVGDINDSDLFVYLGQDLETWVKSLANNSQALDLSEKLGIEQHDDEDGHDEHGSENHEEHAHDETHDHSELHYWTDPVVYMELIDIVEKELEMVDPSNKDYYKENAELYKNSIKETHEEFSEYMSKHEGSEIYFSGHNAMGAFAKRYGVTIVSLSKEYSPDADLSAKQIVALQTKLQDSNSHYLFTEELVEPRLAKQIQNSLKKEDYDVTLLELHGYHNITKEQFEEGVTYAELFKRNTEHIKTAIGD